MRTSASSTRPDARVGEAAHDAVPGARHRLRLEPPLERRPVLDHEARDRAVVDRLQDPLRIVLHDHLLAARPDVQASVVAERAADVEEVVVGIDEEVVAAGPLHVVEGGDRGGDEGAGADGAAGPAHRPRPADRARRSRRAAPRDGPAGRPRRSRTASCAALVPSARSVIYQAGKATTNPRRKHPARPGAPRCLHDVRERPSTSERPAVHRARGADRRGHRGQQPGAPPRPARLDRPGAARQGPASQSGRLDRARVELHLPRRPLARDDRAHGRQLAPVRGAGRAHRVRRHRGRAHRGAHAGAGSPDGVGRILGNRAGLAGHPGRDQGARPLHRRERDRRRLLLAVRERGGLAARGHA